MWRTAFAGLNKPTVAYIGTANGDNPVFFQMMKSFLIKGGAGKVVMVKLAKNKVDLTAARTQMANADVIFLSGGEVEDGIKWLKRHNLVEYLHELQRGGKRIMGVSAGTIMSGSHWVRWEVEGNDDTAELFECLNLTPLVFDTHAEDEDWIELKAVLKLLGDGAIGYGLPNGCVISADSQGQMIYLEKQVLTFTNNCGQIELLESKTAD
jgi:peptidase E